MQTLIENLYNNNVIFSYYGFIDENVLRHVIEITDAKLVGQNEPVEIISKVRDAINECVEHIIKHNFYPDDTRTHYKSLLVVSRQSGHYLIDSINVINADQKEIIHKQLDYLNTKSHEELLNLKQRTNGDKDTVVMNPGLVDLVLKSGNCDFTFKQLEDQHLFNVNYRINYLN